MLRPHAKTLGIMKPLGGGDPIPLTKDVIVVGRRPSCELRLPFENISGKHCQLRYDKGIWHVRDLSSTNGTTINGQKIATEHAVMPDDELGIAGHLYMIDYEPVAPTQVMVANQVLEEELVEGRRRHSLMELAGLERGGSEPPSAPRNRPERAPQRVARPAASLDPDFDDPLPPDAPLPKPAATDEEFFKMIQEDVKDPTKDRKKKK
jgi:FHA domain-containing protein